MKLGLREKKKGGFGADFSQMVLGGEEKGSGGGWASEFLFFFFFNYGRPLFEIIQNQINI